MAFKLHIANCITVLRIIGTFFLMLIKPLTTPFYILYSATGVTDALDGYIARKTNTTSAMGAKLDSIADLLLYAVMLLRIFPVLWELLPMSLWCLVAAIILLRLCSYTLAAVKYRRFAALHTLMNKLSGLMVFAIPFSLLSPYPVQFCWAVGAVTGIATVEELVIHVRGKQGDENKAALSEEE